MTLNKLLNPDVIDAFRSWFATLSGIASSLFAFIIVVMGCVLLPASAQAILVTALVFTHIEAILCLFYLHRVSLEALKVKAGAVEVNLDAQPVQQITVNSPQTIIAAKPDANTTTTTVIETKDNNGTVL